MTYTDKPARYLLTINEARSILLNYGVRVYVSNSSYTLTREIPWYGDSEKNKAIRQGFSVSQADLGNVRDMARAYRALELPQDRGSAEFCRQQLSDIWRSYTAARVYAEELGRSKNDWCLPTDDLITRQQLKARANERATWHTYNVWKENLRERLSLISAEISK